MDLFRTFLAATLLALASVAPARATTVFPLDFGQLVERSTTVIHGRVVANRTERDAATGFVVTYTTFQVDEVLKGHVGSTHVIKQLGGALPGEPVHFHAMGVPDFVVAREYVVFLAGVSAIGFSSPIGLFQGRFAVTSEHGTKQVSNGRLDAMRLDDFKAAVREHLRAVAR
jgi:hypothetical protein